MKNVRNPTIAFGSPRSSGTTFHGCTPTKGSPLPRFVPASPKRKQYEESSATTRGFPSDDRSPGCHSGIIHIEQNSSTREESEIVDDTTHIQTDRPDIDGNGAAKRQKTKNERGLKATLLASSEKYTLNGKPVETERFRAEEQGQKFYEFEMYKGVLIDETVKVSSFIDLTNIFEETFVNQLSRRKEGDTFDSAEREAWMAELVHIESSQVALSTFTADQIRNDTQYRASAQEQTCTLKFAREVNRIHHDAARKPSDVFNALARVISYKKEAR
jgi:hypothetical protein